MSRMTGIVPDVLYPLPAARNVSTLGDTWLRDRRRDPEHPLKVLYCGRSGFVFGRDLIEAIERNSTSERGGGAVEETE